jgi:hypothetical protein
LPRFFCLNYPLFGTGFCWCVSALACSATEGKARRILNLTDDSEKPLGQWNTMVIECLGKEFKVWVNGDFVNHGFDCTARQGQIPVQAEGAEVEFRKLALTPISKFSE